MAHGVRCMLCGHVQENHELTIQELNKDLGEDWKEFLPGYTLSLALCAEYESSDPEYEKRKWEEPY